MRIGRIDEDTATRICGGQVVTTLATALKEILENSLDAGATQVSIHVRNHGVDGLEVSDNGSGVSEGDLEKLASRGATSKITEFDDVWGVASYGFRGEALASLAEVSESLSVLTRVSEEELGWEARLMPGGSVADKKRAPRQIGTTLRIEGLFSRLPVRRREFERTAKRHFTKALQVLQGYALIRTGVRIVVTAENGGRRSTVLTTHGGASIRENISSIFGAKFLESMTAFSCTLEPEGAKVDGYVSKAGGGVGRSSSDRQFLFVNNRPVDMPKLQRVLNDAWRQYEMRHKPAAVLNFTLPVKSFDINVAPDKREIVLVEHDAIVHKLSAALSELWSPSRSTYRVGAGGIGLPHTIPATSSSFLSPDLSQFGFSRTTTKKQPLQASQAAADADPIPQDTKEEEEEENFLGGADTSKKDDDEEEEDDVHFLGGADTSKKDDDEEEKDDVHVLGGADTSKKDDDEEKEDDVNVLGGADTSKKYPSENLAPITSLLSQTQDHSPSKRPNPPTTSLLSQTQDDHFSQPQPAPLESPPESRHGQEYDDIDDVDTIDREEELDKDDRKMDVDFEGVEILGVETKKEEEEEEDDLEVVEETGYQTPKVATAGRKRLRRNSSKTSYDSVVSVPSSQEGALMLSQWQKTLASRVGRSNSQTSSSARLESSQLGSEGSQEESEAEAESAKLKAEEQLSRKLSKSSFRKMHVIGQFNFGFILGQNGKDIFIIDQHASDEKARFEHLRRTTTLHEQPLIAPKPIGLTAAEEMTVMDRLDVFEANGFRFKINHDAPAGERVMLTSVPFSKHISFGPSDVQELASVLTDHPSREHVRLPKIDAMFASRACRSAIMIGKPLNRTTMKSVVRSLAELDQPWNCPHGRPTMRHLVDLDHVEREAPWLPGARS